MTQRQPKIWMNMTTSANWHRPPVGIVRVEQSLSRELGKLYGDQFMQCIWSNGKFEAWSDSATQPKQTELPKAHNLKPMDLPLVFPLLSKQQALIAIGQGFLSLLPGKARPYFNRFLHFMRPRVARFLARPAGKTKKIIPSKVLSAPQQGIDSDLIFAPGDTLISVGLDWDHPYYKHFYKYRKKGIRVVTCCYDLIPVLYPQYCVGEVAGLFTSYFLEIADGSDVVLCISEQSKKDFLGLMHKTGGATPKTLVIPLGDNIPRLELDRTDVSTDTLDICKEPFILFVSTIERRKNHEVLYRAYHLLCAEGRRDALPKLVFVGMQGWGVDELLKDIELDPLTRGLIVRVNHVTDNELRLLYDAALFCVYPSLYEGWGLPVGEALALGKAVLSSNRGSLPEVGGELVRYIDPWSPRDWADEIYRMTTDEAWRSAWSDKARLHYQTKTWAATAETVKATLESELDKAQD